jgi:hypothetical protein
MVDASYLGHVNRNLPELGARRREGIAALRTPNRTTTAPATLTTLPLIIAGCTDSSDTTNPPRTTPSLTPVSTIDLRAQPAVIAHERFNRATTKSERHPAAHRQKCSSEADFTKTSFDPIKTAFTGYIWSLHDQGVEYQGNSRHRTCFHEIHSPESQAAADGTAHGLSDGRQLGFVRVQNSEAGSSAESTRTPPPYLNTAKMIYYEGHWGVYTTTADKSRTCTA